MRPASENTSNSCSSQRAGGMASPAQLAAETLLEAAAAQTKQWSREATAVEAVGPVAAATLLRAACALAALAPAGQVLIHWLALS